MTRGPWIVVLAVVAGCGSDAREPSGFAGFGGQCPVSSCWEGCLCAGEDEPTCRAVCEEAPTGSAGMPAAGAGGASFAGAGGWPGGAPGTDPPPGGAPPVDPPPIDPSLGGAPGVDPGVAGAAGTYPMPDWPVMSAAAAGLDEAALDEAVAAADGADSYCLLVIKNGHLVREHYWRGHDAVTPQRSWSIAKSYTSALVGIAIARGDIESVDQSVADFIPEWMGTDKEHITIGNLLRMDSGLEWDVFTDYVTLTVFAGNQTNEALGRNPRSAPGTEWIYNNSAVQLFEPIFRSATGSSIEEYARQHLWGPVGIGAFWAADRNGNPTPYASVMASCRDHAKLGYLYLHRGNWAGHQVIPADFVDASLTPQTPHNSAYGYLWWTNHPGPPALGALMGPMDGGQMLPPAPVSHFAARGFGNQFVAVFPSLDTIVVRFGPDPMTSLNLDALFDSQGSSIDQDVLEPVLRAAGAL